MAMHVSDLTRLSINFVDHQLKNNLPVILICCTAGLVVAVGAFLRLKNARRSKDVKIPSPPGMWLIGNIVDMLPDNMLKSLRKYRMKYGGCYELRLFSQRFVVLNDSAIIRDVMSKRPKTFARHRSILGVANVFGYAPFGLFFANEPEIFGRVRRVSAPPFSKAGVGRMATLIVKETQLLRDRFASAVKTGEAVNMKTLAFEYTIRVISRVAFGADDDIAQYFCSKSFRDDVEVIFKAMLEFMLWPFPRFLWYFTPMYFMFEVPAQRANKNVTTATMSVIRARMAANTAEKEEGSAETVVGHGPSLLDSMIRQEEAKDMSPLSSEELAQNVKVFYLAGSETTSHAIGWSAFFLSQNPELLAEARKEIDPFYQRFLSQSSSPTEDEASAGLYEAASQMKLVKAIVKESLRLHNPASFLFLETRNGKTEVLSNGVTIYPGDNITCVIAECMRDETVFKDPDEFRPHRWLLEDGASEEAKAELQRMETSYLAFGSGPRLCPGMNLAYFEAAVASAAMLHRYDLELLCPPEEVVDVLLFVTQPSKLPFKVHNRSA